MGKRYIVDLSGLPDSLRDEYYEKIYGFAFIMNPILSSPGKYLVDWSDSSDLESFISEIQERVHRQI